MPIALMPDPVRSRFVGAALLGLALSAVHTPVFAGSDPAPPPAPYWKLGQSEKVQWRPWGEAAFREAEEKGLPVLLDIGTIWCHYCQVMSSTTYSDPGVAENINQYFLPIKVDRDENPEVDARFQAILLELRGMGGWPLTGFLTEEGRMFAGATYLPPAEDKDGRPGLKMVAERYGKSFQDMKRGYNNTAEEVANRFIQASGNYRSGKLDGLSEAIAAGILKNADPVKGGFGNAAKFPEYVGFNFALERGALGNSELERFARETLDGMADGGIRDLLGGGFHRASTDREWRVARFEKLLAVNAGLLELYSEAYRLTGVERYRRVASETVDFLLAHLTDAQAGGFYAAQAADRDGTDNGSTFTWTMAEVKSVLSGDPLKIAIAYFDLKAEPGLIAGQPQANVLAARLTIEAAAEAAGLKPEKAQKALVEAIGRLRTAREARPKTAVDISKYSALNGLAAHALLVAAPVLGRSDARDAALKALDLLLASAWDSKTGFARGLRGGAVLGAGILQDQVYPALALLDAYEATGAVKYRDAAAATMTLALARFEDRGVHRLLDLPAANTPAYSAMVIPSYPVQDTLVPGENAVTALVLARLERLTGTADTLAAARRVVEAFAGSARNYGPNGASLAVAADRILNPPARLVLVGAPGAPESDKLLAAARTAVRRPAVLQFPSKAAIPEWLKSGAMGAAIEQGQPPFAVLGVEGAVAGSDAVHGSFVDPVELSRALAPAKGESVKLR